MYLQRNTCTCRKLHTITLFTEYVILSFSPRLCRSIKAHPLRKEGPSYPLFEMYRRHRVFYSLTQAFNLDALGYQFACNKEQFPLTWSRSYWSMYRSNWTNGYRIPKGGTKGWSKFFEAMIEWPYQAFDLWEKGYPIL